MLSLQFHGYQNSVGETCPATIPHSALFPRYEEEVSLRATAENEFVALKKVSNMGSGSRAMKDLRMTGSHSEILHGSAS